MFYIHHTLCISPQDTINNLDKFWEDEIEYNEPVDNKLAAIEPEYQGVPAGAIRRMGRAARLGVGAAAPLLHQYSRSDGIIIGTSMGCMEDCIRFLNQIMEYNEGKLAPTNFVQSTPNSIAGQLGLLSENRGYNITHVHRGQAFENAAIDAGLVLSENPGNQYLMGAVDEISTHHYNIEMLNDFYKDTPVSVRDLYTTKSEGCIAGEAAEMFLVNNNAEGALAYCRDVHTFHSEDENFVQQQLKRFLKKMNKQADEIDLMVSGENGDSRLLHYYLLVEKGIGKGGVVRFKHLSGEYPTAAGFAFWLSCMILDKGTVPLHLVKLQPAKKNISSILIYNNYKGYQHSFIWLEKP